MTLLAAVSALADIVREHGATLLVGSTVVLGGVALAASVMRSVVARRQLLRCGLVAGGLYLVVAIVPLPRWSSSRPTLRLDATAAAAAATGETGSDRTKRTARPRREARLSGDEERRSLESLALADGDPANPMVGEFGRTSARTSVRTSIRTSVKASAPAASGPDDVAGTSVRRPDRGDSHLAMWLAGALLCGCAGIALHTALGWWRLRRVLARCKPAAPALLAALDAPLPRGTSVWIAHRAVRPFCFGVLRRHVVLPPALASATPAARFVLRHELAHVRGGDTAWCALESMLRPLLWWQPLFWWLRARLRFHDELLADDAAASGDVAGYVRAMLALSCGDRGRLRGAQAAFVFQRPTELYRRCQMILQRENVLPKSMSTSRRATQLVIAALLLVAAGAGFGVERAVAQDPGVVESLRTEVERLRAENARLRAGQTSSPAKDGAKKDEGGLFEELLRDDSLVDRLMTTRRQAKTPEPAPTLDLVHYTVRPGDTLERIARQFYTDGAGVERIRVLNPDLDARQLAVGQKIVVAVDAGGRLLDRLLQPSRGRVTYTVTEGDSLHRIAQKFYSDREGVDRIRRLNPELDPDRLTVGQEIVVVDSRGPEPDSTDAAPQRSSRAASVATMRSRSLDDVARVVTRCIELRGEVRIAEIELERTEGRAESGRIDAYDLQIAGVRLQTAKAQLDAITGMLRAELEGAKAELARLEVLGEQGAVPQHEVAEMRSFVQVLLGVF